MKTLLKLTCLSLTLAAGTAHARTPLEDLEAGVKKYATPYLDVFKGLCTCSDPGGADDGKVGRLRYAIFASPTMTRRIEVWCQVSQYDLDGEPTASSTCDTFQPFAS